MYFCPECDEGPFNPQDWWEHFHSHNIPWLRGRNPKNLERTDLGYGEDLNRTTVPTHDMPNEWHNLTNPPFDGGLSTDPPGAHMGAIRDWERKRQAAQTIPDAPVTPTPKAHRIVWLSQPNNNHLKYWHHNPTNTTYTWDANTGHHWQAWNYLNASKQAHSPNDWDGGFYMQNGMGRHPADLWGLPSQVDYAPVQGDGDYGMF